MANSISENVNIKTKKVVLLHGTGGHGNIYWFPYVREHCEKHGMSVTSPDFPESDAPDLEKWLTHSKETFALDDQTILVGHSLGCSFALSLLQRTKTKIDKAILVAGPYDKTRTDVGYENVKSFLEDYDWEVIKQNCREFVFIHSDNDPWDCDEQNADLAFNHLGGTKIVMAGEGHFGSTVLNQPYPEFPLLLKFITD